LLHLICHDPAGDPAAAIWLVPFCILECDSVSGQGPSGMAMFSQRAPVSGLGVWRFAV